MKIPSFASRLTVALALGLAPALFIDAHAEAARLTVYKSGGNGKVTSSPSGINCGSDCTQRFTIGNNVTLTAAPSSGYEFAGWFGACSGTSPTFTWRFTGRSTCTASFRAVTAPPPPPASYALTVSRAGTGSGMVTSAPAGISCGSTCSASYTSGTSVTLTATAASGSTFNGWSGACTGTAATASVQMSAAKSCTATFNPASVPTQVTLSVSKTGTGSGTVSSSPAGISCGSTCSGSFAQNTTVTLTAAAASGSSFTGWSGSCSGTAATSSVTLAASSNCSAGFSLATSPPPVAGAYYVAPAGSDSTGTGSAASPWKTIAYGISRIAGGDTLVVKNGTYSGKANFITGVKSGTAARPTTIMAESPMDVRIVGNTTLDYDDNLLNLSGSYVNVDGFIFDLSVSTYPPYIAEVSGNYNKLTRSIFKRSGDIDAYGGLVEVTGSENLFEDLAGTGACRYCFKQGGTSGVTRHNIWRRVVARFDYSNSSQPKATFATYGNDAIATNGVADHLYQNVIAIDGQNPGGNGGELKYGAFYFIKAATNVRVQGSIVLNEGVGYSGFHLRDYAAGTNINTATNSVVWDLNNSGSGAIGIKGYAADHLTIGGVIPSAATNLDQGAPASSLLKPATKPANLLDNSPGAVILKRYGASGTRWGETGYDQLTTENLWPWPYQDKIKAVFREGNAVPSGNSPAANNTLRGFAKDGNGLYGGPVTLTSYIWEYLGTACPATACP